MDMIINDLLLFKRASKKEISFEDITKANLKVARPKWHVFEDCISPIWLKVLNGPASTIRQVFDADESTMKSLYENFFVNGLSEGAAIGKKMYEPKSFFKIMSRERRRLEAIRSIEKKDNINFNYDLPDFGCPWLMRHKRGTINFELSDHFYFANFCMRLLKFYDLQNVIVLGDGCGYLAQCMCSLIDTHNIDNVIMIDLYHFLFRQALLLREEAERINFEFLNGETDNYPISSSRKALVNQDSFPEITSKGQDKYFKYMRQNNVSLFISYNKVDHSIGHEEFRERAHTLFKNKVICLESTLRPGYWLEVWHA